MGALIVTAQNTLLGFAVLRANYNLDAPSYLDTFQPFVLAAIAASNKPHMERVAISNYIHDNFGLDIPTMVVKTLLRRTNKSGLTSPVGETAVLITQKGIEHAPALGQEVVQFSRKQNELVEAFVAFVTINYGEHLDLVAEAPDLLLANYFERHAAPLLKEALNGNRRTGGSEPGVDYLISAFITHLSESDQVRFEYVVEAAKGAMLASVLMLDTGGMKESLSDLTLVLDTPVLMDALGFHGDQARVATEQLLALAHAQSASVVTFDHSVGELEGILDHVCQALRKGNRSRSTSAGYLHFSDIGASPADVVLLQSNLHDLLAGINVNIIGRPDGYYEYGLDEGRLEDLIQTKVNYFQDAARVNDVLSLSATHRLRKGNNSKVLEHAKAVLVSSNSNLVRGAIEFDESRRNFPLAIVTDALASILWVKSPTAAPDAPRDVLLAAAFAGMQPGNNVWSKYLDEVDRLEESGAVNADEAIILRTNRASRQSLMEETLGNTDAVTEASPLAALERVKQGVAKPLEDELRELMSRATRANDAAETASADWLRQFDAREAAERRLSEERLRLTALEAENAARTKSERERYVRIVDRATLVAGRTRKALIACVRLAMLILASWGLWTFLMLDDPAGKTGVVLTGIAGFAGLIVAFTPAPDKALDRYESWLAVRFTTRLLRDAGYEAGAEEAATFNPTRGGDPTAVDS